MGGETGREEMKLPDIRKLCEEATPGPWEWETSERLYAPGNGYVIDGHADEITKGDAAFIAASRTLLPKLLKVAEAAIKCRDCDPADSQKAWNEIEEAIAELEGD